jgi:hypothetical protein
VNIFIQFYSGLSRPFIFFYTDVSEVKSTYSVGVDAQNNVSDFSGSGPCCPRFGRKPMFYFLGCGINAKQIVEASIFLLHISSSVQASILLLSPYQPSRPKLHAT